MHLSTLSPVTRAARRAMRTSALPSDAVAVGVVIRDNYGARVYQCGNRRGITTPLSSAFLVDAIRSAMAVHGPVEVSTTYRITTPVGPDHRTLVSRYG